MTDLLALADRVENLTGPDRRVDAAICRFVDLPKCEYPDCLPDVMARILDRVEASGDDPEVPAYTSSIDAAMLLVPEGMEWLVRSASHLAVDNKDQCYANVGNQSGEAHADTGSCALVAAALRALFQHRERDMTTREELVGNLPLQYFDGPDYCAVKDATGGDFALTVQPDLLKAMENALASWQEVSMEELADALQVMIMAWESKTASDARDAIGLSGDIAFPAMPRAIKSYADAKAILQKVRP